MTFGYGAAAPSVLGVSADLPAGSFTAVVGRNGSGKTTLSKLLAGRLTPDHGQVHHNGISLAELPLSQLHAFVLYVPQRPGILNRTLRENLAYPPAAATDEATALEHLKHWDFFDGERDLALEASFGEGGARSSGGQFQKLELARVADIRVPCLILDESTSALDPASEEKVLKDLLASLGARTTLIMVTHRLSIAQAADQVLWMEDGRLAGIDAHEDLMRLPDYQALWGEGESS